MFADGIEDQIKPMRWNHPNRHNSERMDAFHAGGWGDQGHIVIPDLQAVVIMTGGTYTTKTATFAILDKYISPAMESEGLSRMAVCSQSWRSDSPGLLPPQVQPGRE
jgi:hypothetical protein